eukprot:3644663-Heterocapsa_arctica.AAC.1
MEPVELAEQAATAAFPPPPPGVMYTGVVDTVRSRIKIATVIEQGSDMEVARLADGELHAMRQ